MYDAVTVAINSVFSFCTIFGPSLSLSLRFAFLGLPLAAHKTVGSAVLCTLSGRFARIVPPPSTKIRRKCEDDRRELRRSKIGKRDRFLPEKEKKNQRRFDPRRPCPNVHNGKKDRFYEFDLIAGPAGVSTAAAAVLTLLTQFSKISIFPLRPSRFRRFCRVARTRRVSRRVSRVLFRFFSETPPSKTADGGKTLLFSTDTTR